MNYYLFIDHYIFCFFFYFICLHTIRTQSEYLIFRAKCCKHWLNLTCFVAKKNFSIVSQIGPALGIHLTDEDATTVAQICILLMCKDTRVL